MLLIPWKVAWLSSKFRAPCLRLLAFMSTAKLTNQQATSCNRTRNQWTHRPIKFKTDKILIKNKHEQHVSTSNMVKNPRLTLWEDLYQILGPCETQESPRFQKLPFRISKPQDSLGTLFQIWYMYMYINICVPVISFDILWSHPAWEHTPPKIAHVWL